MLPGGFPRQQSKNVLINKDSAIFFTSTHFPQSKKEKKERKEIVKCIGAVAMKRSHFFWSFGLPGPTAPKMVTYVPSDILTKYLVKMVRLWCEILVHVANRSTLRRLGGHP
jgi:methionyl-tRNA synthetase